MHLFQFRAKNLRQKSSIKNLCFQRDGKNMKRVSMSFLFLFRLLTHRRWNEKNDKTQILAAKLEPNKQPQQPPPQQQRQQQHQQGAENPEVVFGMIILAKNELHSNWQWRITKQSKCSEWVFSRLPNVGLSRNGNRPEEISNS